MTIPVLDKATGERLGSVESTRADELDRAIDAAHSAQRAWEATPGPARAAIMRTIARELEERRDDFVDALVREGGAVRAKAEGEFEASVLEFYHAAEAALAPSAEVIPSGAPGRVNMIERRPVGVVGLITAFNAPLHIACRVLAPALGLGNGVILKPAPTTPIVGGELIAQVLVSAGLPDGLVFVAQGDQAGPQLVSSEGVDMIHFTGSEAVGRRINEMAAPLLKRVALELGGNNATVVLADADIERAALLAAQSSFGHQGQVCISTSRHIVLAEVAEEYSTQLAAQASALRVGNPATDDVDLGPLISAGHAQWVLEQVGDAVRGGAQVTAGGSADGAFMEPTVVSGVQPGMILHDEELFAPVAPVVVVRTEEDALAVVNSTRFALSASVFGRDLDRAWRFADQVRTAMVHVNDGSALHETHVPFGGIGASGTGDRLGGPANRDLLTERRWVSLARQAGS